MAYIGYARVSTQEQTASFNAQVAKLKKVIEDDGGDSTENLFLEIVSSVAERDQLNRALRHCRAGDKIVVTKLDRLARSMTHFQEITEYLKSKGASVLVLDLGGDAVDTGTAQGKLLFQMLMAVAEYEREIMLERQRDGIAAAKKAGKYRGRKPIPEGVKRIVLEDLERGFSAQETANRNRVSRRKIFQIKSEHRDAQEQAATAAEAERRASDHVR